MIYTATGSAMQEIQAGADRDFAAADRSGNWQWQDDTASRQRGGDHSAELLNRWRKEYGGLKLELSLPIVRIELR